MLSFIRDPQEAPGQTSKAQAAESTPQPGEQDYLTVAGKTRRTRQSTVAVIVLFAVGLAGLGLMVRKSQPRAAAAAPAKGQESQIEAALGRLTGVNAEMSSHMDQIVQKFHEFSAVAQVAVDELVKNPFTLERGALARTGTGVEPTVTSEPTSSVPQPSQVEVQVQSTPPAVPEPGSTSPSDATPGDTAAMEAQRRAEEAQRQEAERIQQHQQQVRSRAGDLRLQSIIQSSEDTRCLIDDTLVRIGDRVKGFRVMEIGDHWVQLQWSEAGTPDLVVTLRMTE